MGVYSPVYGKRSRGLPGSGGGRDSSSLQNQMPPSPQRNVPVTLARQESGRLVLPALPGPHHHRTPHQDPGPEKLARRIESLVRAFAQGTVDQTIRGTTEPESTARPCLRTGPEVYPDGASVWVASGA